MTGREYCLSEAGKAVLVDRSKAYGGRPENNFKIIAELWNTYLGTDQIRPHDVAIMMMLLKIGRIRTGTEIKEDNWIDIAGYSACGLECQASEEGINSYITEVGE